MSIGVRCCGKIARSIETQFYFHSFIPRIVQSAILPYKINTLPKKKKKKPVKRTQVNLTEPSGAGLGGGMIRVDIDFLEEALQERMIDSAENIGR